MSWLLALLVIVVMHEKSQQIFRGLGFLKSKDWNEYNSDTKDAECKVTPRGMFKAKALEQLQDITEITQNQMVSYACDIRANGNSTPSWLLAMMEDDAARRQFREMDSRGKSIVCHDLQYVDIMELVAVAKNVDCWRDLLEKAKEDMGMAVALLQEDMQKDPQAANWSAIIELGSNVPNSMLQRAPSNVVKEHLGMLLDVRTAPILLPKIDFSSLKGTDLNGLRGTKLCDLLPLSAFGKIPTDQLFESEAFGCVGDEGNTVLAKKVVDRLGTPMTQTGCMRILEWVDPVHTNCWKSMNAEKVAAMSRVLVDRDKVPCDILTMLREKLGLTSRPAQWPDGKLRAFGWLLACTGASHMEAEDIAGIAAVLETQQDSSQPVNIRLTPAVARKALTLATGKRQSVTGSDFKIWKNQLSVLIPSEIDKAVAHFVTTLPQGKTLLTEKLLGMPRPSRLNLMSKVDKSEFAETLCSLEGMDRESSYPGMKNDMGDLKRKIYQKKTCNYKCRTQEQCSLMFDETVILNNLPVGMMDRYSLTVRDVDAGFICGLTLSDEGILASSGRFFLDVASAFYRAKCDNEFMARVLSEKVLKWKKNMTGQMKEIQEGEVDWLGASFFKTFEPDMIKRLPPKVKDIVIPTLGQSDLTDVSSEWLRDTADVAFSHIEPKVEPTFVLKMGQLLCGLRPGLLPEFTRDAMMDAARLLSCCPESGPEELTDFGRRWMDALTDNKNQDFNNMNLSDILSGGNFILTSGILNKIDDFKKSEVLPAVVDSLSEWRKRCETRNKKRSDPGAQRKSLQAKAEKLLYEGLRDLFDGYLSVRRNRSRRAAGDKMSCEDIRVLREHASIFTPQEIQSFSDDIILDCYDLFGSVPSWTDQQKRALAQRGNRHGLWKGKEQKDNLLVAGTISQGLTPDELYSMNIDSDILSILGQLDGWKQDQLDAGFRKWLGTSGKIDAAEIKGEELRLFGAFVCGAIPEHIAKIPQSEYIKAMGRIGDVSCGLRGKTAWAEKAKKALGPVTQWSNSDTAAVDKVLAGLPGEDLRSLSAMKLSYFSPDAFASIPPVHFRSLTQEQLQGLSLNLVDSVTPAQYQALPDQSRHVLRQRGSADFREAMKEVDSQDDSEDARENSADVPVFIFSRVSATVAAMMARLAVC